MVKVLTEKDTDAFIEIRLEGLKESPLAFGASFEEEIDREGIVQNFKNRSDGYFTLGFFEDEKLAGIVGFIREHRLKKKHKGIIWGMYVSPEHRGKGIAKKLVLDVIDRAKNLQGLSKIMLSVTAPQKKAIGFYKRLGFEAYAAEKDAIRVDGQAVEEIFMSLKI